MRGARSEAAHPAPLHASDAHRSGRLTWPRAPRAPDL